MVMHHAGPPNQRNPTVLLTVRLQADDKNPYANLFASSIRGHASLRSFSWLTAIFGAYDLVHFQWPEYIFRGSTRTKALLKYVLASLFLLRLKIQNAPVVLTVHNLKPHESGNRLEDALMARLDVLVVSRTYLNEDPASDLTAGVVILHGRYPVLELDHSKKKSTDLLFFGQLRPYKGIERLIDAFKALPGVDRSLMICGIPEDRIYASSLEERASGDPRVKLMFDYLPDAELHHLISAASVVVLPYHYMYNSGAALLALGHGARVLVPQSGSTSALRRELGSEWVELFGDELSSADLDRCLNKPTPAVPIPEMAHRDWSRVAELQSMVYTFCLDAARLTRSRERQREQVRFRVTENEAFSSHSALNAGETSRLRKSRG